MKKLVSVLCVLLAVVMCLSACGTSGTTSDDTNVNNTDSNSNIPTSELFPARDNVSGKITVFLPWQEDTATATIKKEFEKAYPNTEIEYVTSSWSSRNTKLANFIAAGNSPDIASVNYTDFPLRATSNLIQPIDDYANMSNDLLNKFVMENMTSWNGKNYAIISKRVPDGVYFNTSLFEEAGVKTPLEYYEEDNWTWDVLRDLAKRMTYGEGENKVYGFGIDNEYLFPISAGTDLVKVNGTKAELNIDDSVFRSSMNFFTTMLNTDGSIYPDKWLAFRNGFAKSKIAMVC